MNSIGSRYSVSKGSFTPDPAPRCVSAPRVAAVQCSEYGKLAAAPYRAGSGMKEPRVGVCLSVWLAVGYTMDVVYFSWLETPVDVDTDLQLPHFSLREAILYDCSQNYTAGRSLMPRSHRRLGSIQFSSDEMKDVNAP